MLLFALALVLIQALAIQASVFSHDKPGTDIVVLCADKAVDLTSLSQLRELAAAAVSDSSSCSANVRAAIPELVSVIEHGKDDLCSVGSIDQLKAYYTKYLDTSDHAGEEARETLPKSLKRFAIAYGMQMSNLCKRNMVKVLMEEGHQLLTAEDFAQMEPLTKDEGPVAQTLGAMSGPDEIFMPGDLAPFLKKHGIDSRGIGGEKLFLQMSTGGYVEKLQHVCLHRFKPIYDPLMMPLVRLANLGFNYKDATLKSDLKSPAVVKEVGQWSRIVFLCEALDGIHIVEEQGDKELAQGTESKLVRILTKEDAVAIEGPRALAEEATETPADLVYKPKDLVSLGDLIYDREAKKLVKAVKNFRTSRSEDDIIRARMVNKSKAFIKNQLKAGHVGLIISSTYKSLTRKHKNNELISPSEALVRSLDVMVASQEGAPVDGSVSLYGGDYDPHERKVIVITFVVVLAALIALPFIMVALSSLG